ncbi:hypothetical protein Agub_g13764 [Astrephomene gubernaculifera]|uniref:AP2/ERF domain-containing protein n=1 Tax=Astrephomene gubernaculifera TaxID=47775 RepID=A0AAD3E096_9CHLO|nr:hypothetical protein Agub_g13764 [Astrephomene gubernaculifera]
MQSLKPPDDDTDLVIDTDGIKPFGGDKPVVSSHYRGVCWNRKNRRWQAAINSNGKHLYLGSFQKEEEAARAFDWAAIKLRGNRARTNFPYEYYVDERGNILDERAMSKIESILTSKSEHGNEDPAEAPAGGLALASTHINPCNDGGAKPPHSHPQTHPGCGAEGTIAADWQRHAARGGGGGAQQPQSYGMGPPVSMGPPAATAPGAPATFRSVDQQQQQPRYVTTPANVAQVPGMPPPPQHMHSMAPPPLALYGGMGHAPAAPHPPPQNGGCGGSITTGASGYDTPAKQLHADRQQACAARSSAGNSAAPGAGLLRTSSLPGLSVPDSVHRAILDELPGGCSLLAVVPNRSNRGELVGALYHDSSQPGLVGSCVWTGSSVIRMGLYDTERDARQAAIKCMQLYLAFCSGDWQVDFYNALSDMSGGAGTAVEGAAAAVGTAGMAAASGVHGGEVVVDSVTQGTGVLRPPPRSQVPVHYAGAGAGRYDAGRHGGVGVGMPACGGGGMVGGPAMAGGASVMMGQQHQPPPPPHLHQQQHLQSPPPQPQQHQQLVLPHHPHHPQPHYQHRQHPASAMTIQQQQAQGPASLTSHGMSAHGANGGVMYGGADNSGCNGLGVYQQAPPPSAQQQPPPACMAVSPSNATGSGGALECTAAAAPLRTMSSGRGGFGDLFSYVTGFDPHHSQRADGIAAVGTYAGGPSQGVMADGTGPGLGKRAALVDYNTLAFQQQQQLQQQQSQQLQQPQRQAYQQAMVQHSDAKRTRADAGPNNGMSAGDAPLVCM